MLATILSAFFVGLLFDPTPGWDHFYEPGVLTRLGLFLAGGIGTSLAVGSIRTSRAYAHRQTLALRDSEWRFRGTFENAAVGVSHTDLQGRWLRVNQRLCDMLGYSREDLLNKSFREITHPDDLDSDWRLYERMIRGEIEHYEIAERYLQKGGDAIWGRTNRSIQRDEAGQPAYSINIVEDVTAQKQAEQQLRLQASALEAAANGITITDAHGTILWVNQAFCDLTGYTREETLGRNPRVLKSGRQDEAFYQRMWETIARGEAWHGELVNRRKDGSEYIQEMTISPLRDTQGRITNFIAVKQDISGRRAQQMELATAKESAEQASKAKDQFLAVLSHELRTPLTPVVAAVSMLQEGLQDQQTAREALEMIRRNVEMEARLIDDLLDVTRIIRGKIELDRRPVLLCEVLRRAVDVCRPDMESRQIHFGLDMGKQTPYRINADPARLQQVFWNLLKNAIKFTPHGGRIGIRCGREQGQVVVEVSDSGEGIEPALLPRIFNAFEQGGASVTRQFGGLGLGLTITRGVVEMHGGTVEACSAGKGKGATFRVRLPLHGGKLEPFSACPPDTLGQVTRAQGTPVPAQSQKLKILLVEDHGDTANAIRRLLAARGYQVQTAGDVATALELTDAESFDLLLSDLGLPDGSGVDLLHKLRDRGWKLPAVALSGYGQEEDVRRSKEAGFATHLTKPTNPDQLVKTIDAVARPGVAR